MKITNIQNWGLNISFNKEQPFVIAGPCSAETEKQVLETALKINTDAQNSVSMLRAGIWKPRTRPNSFEGVGEIGLSWLKLAGRTTGLPVCVEVATARHVEQALKHGIDVLWVGARTTVNPFAIQEIADALQGIDIPVFIKNPVNPDLQLWVGAFERFYNAGIHKLAAIHRGFSVYGNHLYRNLPLWEIPIELRRQVPGLEIICDPSHIGGKRSLLLEIAQEAMLLDFDGLMIETHIHPDEAWSDAAQQITPEVLGTLLSQLKKPQAEITDPIFLNKLEKLRKHIDQIDFKVLELLAERMQLVREIGDYKKENNITILQMERWAEIFRSRMATAPELHLAAEFIESVINAIHKESIRQQSEIMKVEMPEFLIKSAKTQ